MKYLFCFLFTLTIRGFLLGQGIKISEFIKISRLNDSEVEIFLNDKGCEIENITEQKHSTTLLYIHLAPKFWVGISDFHTGCKLFYCDFKDSKFFNSQKLEAVKFGFKYNRKDIVDSSETLDGDKYKSIYYIYKKGEDKISFITQIFENHIQYEIAYSYKCSVDN